MEDIFNAIANMTRPANHSEIEAKYLQAQKDISEQLTMINDNIMNHKLKSDYCRDYGHVGDLIYILSELKQINEFIK